MNFEKWATELRELVGEYEEQKDRGPLFAASSAISVTEWIRAQLAAFAQREEPHPATCDLDEDCLCPAY